MEMHILYIPTLYDMVILYTKICSCNYKFYSYKILLCYMRDNILT